MAISSILYVKLARLESPFISSNTNLGVFVKIFTRCEPHLQLIDFMQRRLIWVDGI